MDLTTIGTNIRKHRRYRKLTQEQLAKMTGLTPNYIGMIERGEKIPSLETFVIILNALELSSDKVLSNVLNTGYLVKSNILSDRLLNVSDEERARILAVVETLLLHSDKISKNL